MMKVVFKVLRLFLYAVILFSFGTNAAFIQRDNPDGKLFPPLFRITTLALKTEKTSELSTTTSLRQGLFPTVCTRLHPGTVTKRSLSLDIGAMFLIGDDSLSMHWMNKHLAKLKKLNALGLVISVESEYNMAILRRQADGLTLIVVHCDNLVDILHLDAYPVLITSTELSQ